MSEPKKGEEIGETRENTDPLPGVTGFQVGDLVKFKHGRRVWRLAKIHGRGISGELWKGDTAWGARSAFFSELTRLRRG